jgi:putative membrane protein
MTASEASSTVVVHSLKERPGLWTALISVTIYAVLGYLLLAPRGPPIAPELREPFSLATAASNALTFSLLAAGWLSIRAGNRERHRTFMELALLSISAFLILYVSRQWIVGTLRFAGPEVLYLYVYLPLLIPHLIISAVCVPPVVYNFLVGLTRSMDEVGMTLHPKVGRIVVPLWMISSAQGLVIFSLLLIYSGA